jgi:hypothetical protein
MLGYASAAAGRIRLAEDRAAAEAFGDAVSVARPSTSIVLANRVETVSRLADKAYPHTRATRVTFAGTGYEDGYREGGKADIGGARLGKRGGPAGLGWLALS